VKLKPSVVVASAVFVGALGLGGITLASAQESTTTTPETTAPDGTTNPEGSAPSDSGHNCPERGTADGSGESGGNTGSTSTDAAI
jgi:hypothetical protein